MLPTALCALRQDQSSDGMESPFDLCMTIYMPPVTIPGLSPNDQRTPAKFNRRRFHTLQRIHPRHLLAHQSVEHGDQHVGGGIDLHRVEFTGRRAFLQNFLYARFELVAGLSIHRDACAVRIFKACRAGTQQDAHERRLLGHDRKVDANQLRQPFKGAGSGGIFHVDAVDVYGGCLFKDGGEKGVLALEMVKYGRFGDPHFPGDLQGGGGLKALGGKQADARLEDGFFFVHPYPGFNATAIQVLIIGTKQLQAT
jgi:hypothetical protein